MLSIHFSAFYERFELCAVIFHFMWEFFRERMSSEVEWPLAQLNFSRVSFICFAEVKRKTKRRTEKEQDILHSNKSLYTLHKTAHSISTANTNNHQHFVIYKCCGAVVFSGVCEMLFTCKRVWATILSLCVICLLIMALSQNNKTTAATRLRRRRQQHWTP